MTDVVEIIDELPILSSSRGDDNGEPVKYQNEERVSFERRDLKEGRRGVTPSFLAGAHSFFKQRRGEAGGSIKAKRGGTMDFSNLSEESIDSKSSESEPETQSNGVSNDHKSEEPSTNSNEKKEQPETPENKQTSENTSTSDQPATKRSGLRAKRAEMMKNLTRFTPPTLSEASKTESTPSTTSNNNVTTSSAANGTVTTNNNNNNTTVAPIPKQQQVVEEEPPGPYDTATMRIKNVKWSDQDSTPERVSSPVLKPALKSSGQRASIFDAFASSLASATNNNNNNTSNNNNDSPSITSKNDRAASSSSSISDEQSRNRVQELELVINDLRRQLNDALVDKSKISEHLVVLQRRMLDDTTAHEVMELTQRLEREKKERRTLTQYIHQLESEFEQLKQSDPNRKFQRALYVQIFMWVILLLLLYWVFNHQTAQRSGRRTY